MVNGQDQPRVHHHHHNNNHASDTSLKSQSENSSLRNEILQVFNKYDESKISVNSTNTTGSEADNDETISEGPNKKTVDAAIMTKFEETPQQIRSKSVKRKARFFQWMPRLSSYEPQQSSQPCDLYKIDIQHEAGDAPKRVIFDLIDGIPKPPTINVATNTKQSKNHHNRIKKDNRRQPPRLKPQETLYFDGNGDSRIDYYYFDHGNAQYFETTDLPPVMYFDLIAEKTENFTTKFWAQIFSSIHILTSFCLSFVLQLFRFLLYGFIKPLVIGFLQIFSDYLFKPLLTIIFNSLLQPILIFFYNIATSLRDLCDPLAEGIGYFLRELSVILRSIRLCVYKRTN